MKIISSEKTIEEIIAMNPAATETFNRIGIDYCCGGKVTLAEACKNRGLDTLAIVKMLQGISASKMDSTEAKSCEEMSPSELVDHIEQTHHALLWKELERLDALTDKVARVHGPGDSRLAQVRETFLDLAREISDHMRKEENILFPLIREIQKSPEGFESHCGSVANPIRQMDSEHEDAGIAFLKLRKLTDGFNPPPHACYSYRAMLTGLEEMESNLHEHMRKESLILFPKIIDMEQSKLSKMEI
jgi:regulator of cell morphogenesis and NO signaling